MFCPDCGNKLPEDASFCPHCGRKIGQAATEQPGPAEPPAQPPRPTEEPTAQPQEPAAAPPPQAAAPPQQPAPPTPEPAAGPQQPPAAAAAPPEVAPGPSEAAPATPPVAPGAAEAPPKKKSATCWVVGCIVVFVLLVLGIGGFFLLRTLASRAQEAVHNRIEELEIQVPGETGEGEEEGESERTDESTGLGGESDGDTVGLSELFEEMGDHLEEAAEQATEQLKLAAASATLNAFLEAQGRGDGHAMQNFLTPELRKDFMPEIWGQGDSEHKDWNVVNQQQIDSDTIQFEVDETLRDHADNTTYTDRWTIRMAWDGDQWQVAQHDLAD